MIVTEAIVTEAMVIPQPWWFWLVIRKTAFSIMFDLSWPVFDLKGRYGPSIKWLNFDLLDLYDLIMKEGWAQIRLEKRFFVVDN